MLEAISTRIQEENAREDAGLPPEIDRPTPVPSGEPARVPASQPGIAAKQGDPKRAPPAPSPVPVRPEEPVVPPAPGERLRRAG